MSAPPRPDEAGIEQMWKETQIEFQKLSGKDPQSFTEMQVEDVLGKLQEIKDQDDKIRKKHRRAKDILNKTLLCIQTLGSLAKNGASDVSFSDFDNISSILFIFTYLSLWGFPPATICFNAVSHLITTAQNYSKVFDGLSELFDHIFVFLDRFKFYARKQSVGMEIDLPLRRIIHELLQSVIRVCALSIKISKQSKFRLALEVFSFRTDKGVSDELTKLESLVQREIGANVASILASAKASESNIVAGFSETSGFLKDLTSKMDGFASQFQGFSGYVEKRERAHNLKEADGLTKLNREKIKHALKIDKETWRTDQEEYVRTRVAGAGEWLFRDAQFVAWAGKSYAEPIIALEAKEGFGKSHLCSTAIRHIQGLQLTSSETRASIAYYYFPKNNKDESPVSTALKAIIWQLTQHDPVYQKAVAGACKGIEELKSPLELWKQLIVQLATRTKATAFIFLDGIEKANKEPGSPLIPILRDVSQFAAENCPFSLRLFITGCPRSLVEIDRASNIRLSVIELGTRNVEDIHGYIDARIKSMEVLKSDEAGIRELRERIRTELADGVKGDYFKLNYILTGISKKRRRKEIEEVLQYAGEDRLHTIAREVDRLHKSLNYEDVQDLNELLTWVIGAKQWPSVKALEAVLFVKNEESTLMPLEKQIQDKYSALLEVTGSQYVTITSDSIMEYFQQREDSAAAENLSTIKTLHPSEVVIVKRFLRSVCDDDLYTKFGFEGFFQQKLSPNDSSITVPMGLMHVHVILSCLKTVCGDPREELTALAPYAYYWLPDHLYEVDLALIPP